MDEFLTIAQMIADALDLAEREINDLLQQAPFVAMLPSDQSSNGTMHAYTKRVGAPTVGFRNVNAGRALSKSTDQRVEASLEILDWTFAVDQAAALAWRKGKEHFLAREGMAHIAAALFVYEKQLFNGTLGGDADGFLGFANCDTLNAKTLEMVVDATGTTVNGATSVYAVRLGENDVLGVYKGEGDVMDVGMGETVSVPWTDGEGKTFPAFYTPANTWLGLQVGGARSIGRICNLTTENNKTLNDDMLASLISKFPAGMGPTHFLMNRQSLAQLRDSRTATNATGAPAPFPTESFNVPIVTTDAISNTEALLA